VYTIADIEDAILDTLKADTVLKAYVKTFSPIPALDQATLEKTFRQLPAIGVISDEGTYEYAIGSKQQDTGSFAILCFHKNVRSLTSAMRGGTSSEKGVWDMIDDCRRVILPGALSGVTIIDCLARRRKLLYAGEKGAAAALELEVKWRN
jgi:hypothetical protein